MAQRKQLIVVNGTMGVGKSAVSRELLATLPGGTAWLDGDWCWTMHPFRVTEENVRMVEGNIVHVLRSLLTNSSFEQVLFSWVIHRREILDGLLARLGDLDFDLRWFTLVADPVSLRERMLADGRAESAIAASLGRIPLYEGMPSRAIDTRHRGASEVAAEIRGQLASAPAWLATEEEAE